MTTVLITGVGGPAGSSLARQLIQRGIRVHGVDMLPAQIEGIGFETVLPCLDAGYPAQLIQIADRVGADLIIPTVSEELPIVATLADPRITVASCASVSVAADKWLTCRVLAIADLPVPRSVPIGQLDATTADWIGLPAVTKPRVGHGGRGVEVHDHWFDLDRMDTTTLVSEFAPGQEYCPNLFIAADPADDVALIETFMRHAGQVLSREQLLSNVWGYDFDTESNVVDVLT